MTKEAIALTPNEKLQEFLSSYGQIVLIKQHCMLQTNNDSNNVTEAIQRFRQATGPLGSLKKQNWSKKPYALDRNTKMVGVMSVQHSV